MLRSLLILITGLTIVSCASEMEEPSTQAEYTYTVKGWESLGSQTLVLLQAGNPSSLEQEIRLQVEVINTEGKVFSKDTAISLRKTENQKDFQLMVDTEGQIEDVKVYSIH